ncbi:Transmembrane channel-like protein 3, partial [Frankliniella fusca]
LPRPARHGRACTYVPRRRRPTAESSRPALTRPGPAPSLPWGCPGCTARTRPGSRRTMAPTATSLAATPSTYSEPGPRSDDEHEDGLLGQKRAACAATPTPSPVDGEHPLPVLKVTLPPDTDAEDSHWKLDRRDSGSLFWRRDSVACKTSRIKFRLDVDVREYQPRPEERLPAPHPHDDEEDEDIYSDDYILRHDVDLDTAGSWLRPSLRSLRPGNLFGARRLRARRRPYGAAGASGDPPPKESSVFMSLVCVLAILVTAWLQGAISPINL